LVDDEPPERPGVAFGVEFEVANLGEGGRYRRDEER
jgi:hypothetical protein